MPFPDEITLAFLSGQYFFLEFICILVDHILTDASVRVDYSEYFLRIPACVRVQLQPIFRQVSSTVLQGLSFVPAQGGR